MFKNWRSWFGATVVCASLLAGVSPGAFVTADGINVTKNTAVLHFPSAISFTLEATGSTPIVDVRLFFVVERDSFANVFTEEKPLFTAGTVVKASHTWDMRRSGGLPVGAVVEYWWTLTDSAGDCLVTSRQRIVFEDMRFNWRHIDGGYITLYWYSGTESFARGLLDAAQQGLAQLEANTGAHLSRPVSIYIYENSDAMRGAMMFPQEWTGGAAYPAYSTIIIGINASSLEWGKRALVHELAHMVNYQMTTNPYSSLPIWLEEGLAMYAEGSLDTTFRAVLTAALMQDMLFSVRSMASPFSTDALLAYLGYAESYSVVDYLISVHGREKMAQLLETFSRGSTCDGALLAVYGFDMDGLYSEWVPFARQKYLGAAA
ncbi:MAG: peptidase MA family metallohydrolase [Dehalococcoidia bacterium]|nr:peptidase MA family metallohydrolase [Dehalococcoidia bacterium]